MRVTEEQQKEIDQLRLDVTPTRRAISKGLEDILYTPHPVLDHGFVRVVDYMGNDESIVQAARVSYGSGTKKVQSDEGLIRYLLRNWHTTPFEMCEIKFHIKLPIFIARQWIRHRTANVNEYSGRYSVMDGDFYTPEDGYKRQSSNNKQGSNDTVVAGGNGFLIEDYAECCKAAFKHYDQALEYGVSREQARMHLPVSGYTQWYWKIDLHNLMHFLYLRADPHAQKEIRDYADVMSDILKAWLPITHKAFEDYRLGAKHFSKQQINLLKDKLLGCVNREEVLKQTLGNEDYNMSKRELNELFDILGVK